MKIIELAYCLSEARKARKLAGCPETCAPIYEPVCDSQGDIHYNECFFRKTVCEASGDDLNNSHVSNLRKRHFEIIDVVLFPCVSLNICIYGG